MARLGLSVRDIIISEVIPHIPRPMSTGTATALQMASVNASKVMIFTTSLAIVAVQHNELIAAPQQFRDCGKDGFFNMSA